MPATADDLPVPADSPRTYIRVQPSDAALAPETVVTQCRRLHALLSETRTHDATALEVVLVAIPDEPLEYCFGIDDEEAATRLERALRGLLPNTYECERRARAPTWVDRVVHAAQHETDAAASGPASTDDGAGTAAAESDADVKVDYAAVTYTGHATRPKDWQIGLRGFKTFLDAESGHTRVPLATIVEALADSPVPVIYQALVRAKPDWTGAAEARQVALEGVQDTWRDRVVDVLLGPPDLDTERMFSLPASDAARLDDLENRETAASFDVAARAVAVGEADAVAAVADDLASGFADVGRPCYGVRPRQTRGTAARAVFDAIRDRTIPRRRLRDRLPRLNRTRPTIVADAREVASFFLVDGGALTTAAARAVDATPRERTPIPLPPPQQLDAYRDPGFTLGYPLTADGQPQAEPIAVPPSLRPLHVACLGGTGSGKSTATLTAILNAYTATGGLTICNLPKGAGAARDLLRTHYAQTGSLDDVYFFDCAEMLPALSFFDIRPGLDAGIGREILVADVVDHYIDIVRSIMGTESFERAARSPDIIRYLLEALFDPVHGSDAFTHRDLQDAASHLQKHRDAPPVSDPDLEKRLETIAPSDQRSFDAVILGVLTRIEKAINDSRLATLFNYVPETPTDPVFDFYDFLDEDALIIVDTGRLRPQARRAVTLVLLSNLWTALRRRAHHQDVDADPQLVSLLLEEAGSVATSDLVTDLLAQSRGFGLSLTLVMQFAEQLHDGSPGAYHELLNNAGTVITGRVAVDRDLEHRLATDDMSPADVGNRLRALDRGQWLVDLPAPFGASKPRPFVVESVPLPPGHPDGSQPLSTRERAAFDAAVDAVIQRTRSAFGREIEAPTQTPAGSDDSTSATPARPVGEQLIHSALPHTKRLPTCVSYEAAAHALNCVQCGNRYGATRDGLLAAIDCCTGRERVERDDVPIVEIPLALSPAEREASEYTDQQLMFLQAVYTAHQRGYDPEWEYDLLRDSMVRLQEYVGIDAPAVRSLVDDGLLAHDCDHPHRLYTVTPAGRAAIQVSHREGVAYGHGKGDLSESSLHVVMVELGRRYIEQAYVDDPESPVVEAIPYYEHDGDDEHRLDAVGIDAAGDVLVTLEAERSNHDTLRAVPEDYDKMAALDPEAAIWLVENRDGAHDVLGALNDPPAGPPRVEKTYNRNTPPQSFTIESPGLTQIHTLRYLRDRLLEPLDSE